MSQLIFSNIKYFFLLVCKSEGIYQMFHSHEAADQLFFPLQRSMHFFFKPKLLVSCYQLWLHKLVCVKPGRKSQRDFLHMSRVMRKPTICICKNKDADQLRSNREADQGLCFRYSDSTVPLLLKSEISSF